MVGSGEIEPKYGDILAVEGSGWLSRAIIHLTRRAGAEQASHVGIITATVPYAQVTEALTDIQTRPLKVSIQSCKHAYLIRTLDLTKAQRAHVTFVALGYSGTMYGWSNILWQFLDAVSHTTFFTTHLGETRFPICSMLDDIAFQSVGVHFGTEKSVTPNQILDTALKDSKRWTVTKIK